ncbi:MAG: hypothetical protein IT377_04115 [Polyangiaceae bacterium]|nr:hypothetical protein [Polyangiaceae bacterium]
MLCKYIRDSAGRLDRLARDCGQTLTYECEAGAISGCSLDDASEREGCQALGR